jgi:uncharacterized membrane protein YhhN
MRSIMQTGTQKKLTIVFWLLALLDIICIILEWKSAHYIVKMTLMPALIILLSSAKENKGKKIILAGLIFSWIGDGLLLFESKDPMFFICGLASFLATHIFYIIYFLNINSPKVSLLKKMPILIVPVLAYAGALVWLLFPHLGAMKIPVMAYAVVISTMLICSLYARGKVNKAAGNLYVLGAIAFVLSDSLLAINKFYQPIPSAGVLIMLTYCAAQFLIVTGFLKQDT